MSLCVCVCVCVLSVCVCFECVCVCMCIFTLAHGKVQACHSHTSHTSRSVPVSELAKMRQQLEEEIRAQLMANQEMLNDNEQDWNEKVSATLLVPDQ